MLNTGLHPSRAALLFILAGTLLTGASYNAPAWNIERIRAPDLWEEGIT